MLRVISSLFKLDGDIKLNGENSGQSGSPSGGASGGSAWITTSVFSGSGSLSVNGGVGDNLSGGGSGGRIAVHFEKENTFEGLLTAYGGASTHEVGAAGTILTKNIKSGASNLTVANLGRKPATLKINNYGQLSTDSARTWIPLETGPKVSFTDASLSKSTDTFLIEHRFQYLTLGGSAHVAFALNSQSYISTFVVETLIGTFEGDSYGYIHSGARQCVAILKSDFYVPINLQVYRDGSVQLPKRVMLHKNNLNLDGSLSGLQELSVSASIIQLSASSSIGYSLSSTPGIDVNKLTVLAGASIVGPQDTLTSYTFKVTDLTVEASGKIKGRNLLFDTNTFILQDSSILDLDFGGFKKKTGPGYGHTDCNATRSSGGSHAGYGGRVNASQYGDPYDNLFQPAEAGSGGGGLSAVTDGAEGGGVTKIVAVTLTIDGSILAR